MERGNRVKSTDPETLPLERRGVPHPGLIILFSLILFAFTVVSLNNIIPFPLSSIYPSLYYILN